MTHDEYLATLEDVTDEGATGVIAHVRVCGLCRTDHKVADAHLARLEPKGGPRFEEVVRVAAVVAMLAILISGLSGPAGRNGVSESRYRIVGDSSGVVAYTPTETVVAGAARPLSARLSTPKEDSK